MKARILATTSASAGLEMCPAAMDGLKEIAHAAYLEHPAHELSPERRAALHRIPQSRARIIRLRHWSSVAAACLIALFWWRPSAPGVQTTSAPRSAPQTLTALTSVGLHQEIRSIGLETSVAPVAACEEAPVPEYLVTLKPLDAQPLAFEPPVQVDVLVPEAPWAATAPAVNELIAPNYRSAAPRFQQALNRGGQRLLVRTRGKFGWEVPEGSQIVKFRVHVGRLHWTAAH